MKKWVVCLLLLTMLCVPLKTFAQGDKLEKTPIEGLFLEDLPEYTRNEVIKARKKLIESQQLIPQEKLLSTENITKIAGLGKEIGTAVAELCKTLGVEVNEFAKTNVGLLLIGLLLWKLLAKEILCLIAICFMYLMILWSYRKFHVTERVVKKNDKKEVVSVEFIPRYKFVSSKARTGSAAVHAIAWILLSITTILILCL